VNAGGAARRDARASVCSQRPTTRRPPRVGRAAHVRRYLMGAQKQRPKDEAARPSVGHAARWSIGEMRAV